MAGSESFDAAEVARKEFATGFRGFDQYEVRAYLAKLAAEMGVLQERDRGLRERLADLERKRPSERALADEEIEAALGAEATKVIHAARQAAAEIRAKAEENVARLLREAQDEAQAMRTEASGILAARTEEAEAVAAGIVEAAQSRGREMVAEAQAVRERMLRDLARRRRHAEAQVQLLLGGRERLSAALDRAGQVVGEANAQLGALELADLPPFESSGEPTPSTAPPSAGSGAPGVVPAAPLSIPPTLVAVPSLASEGGAGEPGAARPGEASPPSADAPPSGAPPAGDDTVHPIDERRPGSLRLLRRRAEPERVNLDEEVEGVRILREERPDAVQAAPAVEMGGIEPAGAATPAEVEPVGTSDTVGGEAGAAATPVEDLFARLRADRAAAAAEVTEPRVELAEAEAVADPRPSDVAVPGEGGEPAEDDAFALSPEPERGGTAERQIEPAEVEPVQIDAAAVELAQVDAAFESRDAALEGAERALSRSLKRALADEQNEVLDALRRLKGTPRIDVLLPSEPVHRSRYQRVADGPLLTAVEAGGAGTATVSVDELSKGFADEVSGDLRARLERALDAGTTDAEALVEAISAGYREWKSGRSDATARHHAAAAYSAAVYAAAPDGWLLWIVDPAEGGCPDCDDNALAGPTPKGTPFPTGQLHPPAHVGCRCLVRPQS